MTQLVKNTQRRPARTKGQSLGADGSTPLESSQETSELTELRAKVAAISKAQAMIEFELDGTIIDANTNFLDALGYSLSEVKGKHHRMFVDPDFARSREYEEFWAKLNRGEYEAAEYKRLGKGGREVWINASYNPILDLDGNPFKVMKFATDVTAEKLKNADYEGQIAAISKAQAVIEFELDGTIIDANANFLDTLGYSLSEVKGKHHRMFVDPEFARSREYEEFWAKLNRGQYQAAEYKRLGKGGREVWINASYNPILDHSGKPFKVVKFATDVTAEKQKNVDFKKEMDGLSDGLGGASSHLLELSQTMESTAAETSEQAIAVSASAEQVSQNVATVAVGVEEMSATVREIARNASEASSISSEGVDVALETNESVAKLGVSSTEIGKVIKVITSIAQQTNLLALNATIEAARAGDAGRGFAVVANEVKELAKETAAATEDIGQKIEAIQTDSRIAAEAIDRISEIVGKVSEIQTTIAGAVDEQTATTAEMARNIAEAASGSTEIAANIGSVASAAKQTAKGAGATRTAAEQLGTMSKGINTLVDTFTS